MSTFYRERISDERPRGVTEYVRAWLFGNGDQQRPKKPAIECE